MYIKSVLACYLSFASIHCLIADESKLETSLLDDAHQNLVQKLDDGVKVLPETVQSPAGIIVRDIKKDGKNLMFYSTVGYTEFHPISNDNGLDGEIDSEPKSITSGTVGVTLLPNTWRLDISYSGTISESNGWIQDSYVGLDNHTYSVVGYNEGDTKTSSFKFYSKPILGKYGSFGFGFKQFKATFGINPYGIVKAVDTPQTRYFSITSYTDNDAVEDLVGYPRDPNDHAGFGAPNLAWVSTTTNSYFMTYNLPDNIDYIPNGLGFIASYSTDDIPVFIGYGETVILGYNNTPVTVGKVALNPDTKSLAIGFGIFKTLDELPNGFSFKNLSYTIINKESSYYDHIEQANKKISGQDLKWTLGPSFVWKWGAFGKVFVLPELSITKLDGFNNAEAREISLDIGLRF